MSGDVLIRTYEPDGSFYREVWTTLSRLMSRGYLMVCLELQEAGRCTVTLGYGQTLELIAV